MTEFTYILITFGPLLIGSIWAVYYSIRIMDNYNISWNDKSNIMYKRMRKRISFVIYPLCIYVIIMIFLHGRLVCETC